MTALDSYLEQFPAMQRGRLRNTLTRVQGFARDYQPRHRYAERIATAPGARVDYDKGRVYTSPEIFFDIADVTKGLADYLAWLQSRATAETR